MERRSSIFVKTLFEADKFCALEGVFLCLKASNF